jgi:hypothetical protein
MNLTVEASLHNPALLLDESVCEYLAIRSRTDD